VYGDGTQTRDFTYIDDLCKGIEDLLNSTTLNSYYDLGGGNSYSLNEIIYLIATLADKVVRIEYKPMNRFDVMHTKAEDPFLEDITPLKIGLKKQIEWAKKKYEILDIK
jgi:nucleoside-diphosphate-sugar epimerase